MFSGLLLQANNLGKSGKMLRGSLENKNLTGGLIRNCSDLALVTNCVFQQLQVQWTLAVLSLKQNYLSSLVNISKWQQIKDSFFHSVDSLAFCPMSFPVLHFREESLWLTLFLPALKYVLRWWCYFETAAEGWFPSSGWTPWSQCYPVWSEE